MMIHLIVVVGPDAIVPPNQIPQSKKRFDMVRKREQR